MRTFLMALCLSLAPALAQTTLAETALAQTALVQTAAPPTIAAADAKAHVGQTAVVQASVSAVRTGRSGATFIDMDGLYPDNRFAAVIFVDDIGKFPGVKALEGKTVSISGPVQLYQGRPEIVLKSAAQLRTR
ncbi:MAG TPA: hypothetical protein VIJ04_10740 [Xanthobacteraceae bacterium]